MVIHESNANETSGLVFDIQRYTIHDGPGVRTLVFTMGCPLRCIWCSNPESQVPQPKLRFFRSYCTGCQRCLAVCPRAAITWDAKKQVIVTDRNLCNACGECERACLNQARKISGRLMTVNEVMSEVNRDWLVYKKSGGGLTISGGEPLMQPIFVTELLRAAKQSESYSMNTVIETCGYSNWEDLERMLPYLDLIFFDVKHIDSETHARLTGVTNELILANLERLSRVGVPITVRIPVVPGMTDSDDNLCGIADFINERLDKSKILGVELMPYHRLGASKYEQLDRQYTLNTIEPVGDKEINRLKGLIRSRSVTCL